MVDRKFASNELLGSSTNKVGLQHLTETQLRSGALDNFVPRRRESYVAHIERDEPATTLAWDTGQPRPGSAASSSRGRNLATRKARRKRIAAASGRLREQLQRLQYARDTHSDRMVVTGTVSQARPQSAAPIRITQKQSKGKLPLRPASAASSRQSSASTASGLSRSLPGGATAAYGHTCRGSRQIARTRPKQATKELFRVLAELKHYMHEREIRAIDIVRRCELLGQDVIGALPREWLGRPSAPSRAEPVFSLRKLYELLTHRLPGLRMKPTDARLLLRYVEAQGQGQQGQIDCHAFEALLKQVARPAQDPMDRLALLVSHNPTTDMLYRNSGRAYASVHAVDAATARSKFSTEALHKLRRENNTATTALEALARVLIERRTRFSDLFPAVAAVATRPAHLRQQQLCTVVSENECWRTNSFRNSRLKFNRNPEEDLLSADSPQRMVTQLRGPAFSVTASSVEAMQQRGWVSSDEFRRVVLQLATVGAPGQDRTAGDGVLTPALVEALVERFGKGNTVDVYEVERSMRQVQHHARRRRQHESKLQAHVRARTTVGSASRLARPFFE